MKSLAVESVESADEARAVSVQVMAFGSDPIMRWLYPDADAYLTHFPSFVRAFGGAAFAHGSAFASHGFGGAALWLPEGVSVAADPFVSHVEATIDEPMRSDVLGMLEKMEEFHTKEPHWYLAMIGVEPASQGLGIGATLLQHTLARVDEQGLHAYLESSNPANVPLYQRHGFEVIGEIQVGGSPPIFPMLRTPRV